MGKISTDFCRPAPISTRPQRRTPAVRARQGTDARGGGFRSARKTLVGLQGGAAAEMAVFKQMREKAAGFVSAWNPSLSFCNAGASTPRLPLRQTRYRHSHRCRQVRNIGPGVIFFGRNVPRCPLCAPQHWPSRRARANVCARVDVKCSHEGSYPCCSLRKGRAEGFATKVALRARVPFLPSISPAC